MNDHNISELFSAIAEWALAKGIEQINQFPGCWEGEMTFEGKPAKVAVNGHTSDRETSWGSPIPPFHALIEINGWPAVLCNPYGGFIMGGGEGAEGRLIEAFNKDRPS